MMVPLPVPVMIMKMEHHAGGGGDVEVVVAGEAYRQLIGLQAAARPNIGAATRAQM